MMSLKGEEMLIQDIIEGKYKSDYIIISLETLQKNAKKLLENRFIDIVIQITNPISEGKYNLCIVHFVKTKLQKFLTQYISDRKKDYKCGIDEDYYIKKIPKSIDSCEEIDIDKTFKVEKGYLASCHIDKNFFTYVQTKEEAMKFQQIAGKSSYIGRERIEFYPQELMFFHLSNLPGTKTCTALENMQNKKSKYKVPQRTVLLETSMLRPMVKGRDIMPFHVECGEYIVPFPYDKSNPRVPMTMDQLMVKAPRLSEYYRENKKNNYKYSNYYRGEKWKRKKNHNLLKMK